MFYRVSWRSCRAIKIRAGVGAGEFRNALIAILARVLLGLLLLNTHPLYDIVAGRMTRESSSINI
jgi:hypothetical protein